MPASLCYLPNAQAWIALIDAGLLRVRLPPLLSTSFSCHSCCSHFSVFGRVNDGGRSFLHLAEDVQKDDSADVNEADDHDGVWRQLESVGLLCKE